MTSSNDPRQATPAGPAARDRSGRSDLAWLIGASAVAGLWCAFCLAGLGMDLFYTEDWYYELTDDQQQAAYRCLFRRMAMAAGPLGATNLAAILLLRAAVRRAS